METNGFKLRIEKAFINKEFIKILFRYSDSDRTIVKRGLVISCFEDCFEFEEIMDGLVTYSYSYIIEIKGEEKNGGPEFYR